jgi:hypothetical protein
MIIMCSLRKACRALALGGIVLSVWGCGSNLYELAEVTGKVTCNGEPALGGWVIFEPIDAPEQTGRPPGEPGGVSRGIVKEDGSFTLMMDAKGSYERDPAHSLGPVAFPFIRRAQNR